MRVLTFRNVGTAKPTAKDRLRPSLPFIAWATVTFFAFVLVASVVGAPFAQAHGHPVFASSIYKTFSFVCHQIPQRSEQVIERPKTMGITDPQKTYDTDDLAPGKKIIFAATGVTDGALMRGVRFFGSGKRTHSLVMTTESKHIRFVDTVHIEGGPDTVIRF